MLLPKRGVLLISITFKRIGWAKFMKWKISDFLSSENGPNDRNFYTTMAKYEMNRMDVIQLFETLKLHCPVQSTATLDFILSHINAAPLCNTISVIFTLILSFLLRLDLCKPRSVQFNTKWFNNICWRLEIPNFNAKVLLSQRLVMRMVQTVCEQAQGCRWRCNLVVLGHGRASTAGRITNFFTVRLICWESMGTKG